MNQVHNNVFYKLGYAVQGIKVRCRKTERHFITIANLKPDEIADRKAIERRVCDSINSNFKSVLSREATVSLDHITIKNYGGDFVSEEWQPFSKENIKFKLQLN
jgi:hypothetical protein